jgi:transglutaminase-like putative cysteine protease
LRAAVLAVLSAVLVGLAAGAPGRIYHGPLFAELMAGAAIGAAALSLLLVRRPQWMVAPISVLGMLGYLFGAVWWSARAAGVTGTLPSVFADALRNGGPRLFTALIPVEAEPDTVLLPALLTWLATLICAELALRGRRVALALIPPTLVYLAGLIMTGPHGGVQEWRAVGFVAVAAALLAAATPRGPTLDPAAPSVPARQRAPLRGQLRLRAAAGVAIFVALAAAVVPAVALRLPDRPADPRTVVSPPQLDTLDQDPLARISGWAQNPTESLFDATVSTGTRITLAVLSDFDGVTWTIGAHYRDAGRALPAPVAPVSLAAPASVGQVSQQITVRDLTGRLVPAVSAPRQVDGIRVGYDQVSGTLLRESGLTPGTSYSVVSQVPHPDANLLPQAGVPHGPAVARFLAAGTSVPPDVAALADTIATGNAGDYQRAYALQQFLAEHYTFVTDAPSGHAYPNLRFFLLDPPQAGGGRGSSEQFATAYAVLGRLMGLPTRVVVGFTAAAGQHPVLGRDALAWPEVLFNGVGWVPFNPMPTAATVHRPLTDDYQPKPPPPPPSDEPSTAPPLRPSRSASASPSAHPLVAAGAGTPPWLPWAAGGGLLALLLLAQGGVLLARRRLTHDRLTAKDPLHRVGGAWLQVLDALRLAGRPPAEHLAATEVAAFAATGGLPSVRELAELVNMVGFAAESADERDAGTAVGQARAFSRALRRSLPLWRRLLWPLRPGPLRWRHHSAPSDAPPAAKTVAQR